jgi:hypothetical protein
MHVKWTTQLRIGTASSGKGFSASRSAKGDRERERGKGALLCYMDNSPALLLSTYMPCICGLLSSEIMWIGGSFDLSWNSLPGDLDPCEEDASLPRNHRSQLLTCQHMILWHPERISLDRDSRDTICCVFHLD